MRSLDWLSAAKVNIGGQQVTLASLLISLGIMFFGFVLAAKLSTRVRGAADLPSARWRTVLGRIAAWAIRLVTFSLALQVAGVNIASVLAAGAVVAVGIGIAMQKVAENFVSGVILMAERSIREGDIIEFDGRIAKVRHMGIRATIALTLDNEEIIVPNSLLAQSSVKNLTLSEPVYRLRVKVGIAYGADVTKAEIALMTAAEGLAWRNIEHPPIVLLGDFGASSIDFEVSVWTTDVWAMRRGQSELRKAIWAALRDAAIAIPFPQLDVHIDRNVPAVLTPAKAPAAPRSEPNTIDGA